MGLKKRICLNGHDTSVTGRHVKNNSCKICYKERRKRMREAKKAADTITRDFDLASLPNKGA
jgi:hypothetical protein